MKPHLFFTILATACIFCSSGTYAQIISTIAGNGTIGYAGDGGAATSAEINNPYATAVDTKGNVYIADYGANVVRKIDTAGIITTFAGTGVASTSGDGGAATSATLDGPIGVAADMAGNVYISEYLGWVIRKVDTSGIISTVPAGGLYDPTGICVDRWGNLFIANQGIYEVVEIDTTGSIFTVAGNGSFGYTGDGGAATSAALGNVTGVAVDKTGNLYIAMWNDEHLRRVDASTGIISTIAGTGTAGFSGDGGPATSAELSQPYSVAVDTFGNVYIADVSNYRIRKITASTGIINTIAGTGSPAYNGDGGLATDANISSNHVFVSASGDVYICDAGNSRIRKVSAFSNVITGPDSVCVGGTITLADTFHAGAGTWSSSLHASVDSTGVVTGLTAGLAEITYTVITDIDTITATKTVVVTNPVAAPITGTLEICTGTTTYLADADSGGTWSSGSTGVAIIDSSTGFVSGLAAGSSIIVYSVNTTCGVAVANATITVDTFPSAGTITGPGPAMCVETVVSFSDDVPGGAWNVSDMAIGDIFSDGALISTGPGTEVVLYSVANACGADTATDTIGIVPPITVSSIGGPSAICDGATATLTDTAGGGVWQSSITSVATIDSFTGLLTSIAGGETVITYTAANVCGTSSAEEIITVEDSLSVAAITGTDSVCVGDTIWLHDATLLGTWAISNGMAGMSAGPYVTVITGEAPGLDTVSYSLSNTCGTVTATLVVRVKSADECASQVNNVAAGGLAVYPNPSNGSFTVDMPALNADAQLRITDMLGGVVYARTVPAGTQKTVCDPGNIPAGTYIIEVCTASGNYRVNVVVMK